MKVALVGCGNIARRHINAIGDVGGAEIVAVADHAEQAAKSVGERLGARAYLDYREMFEKETPDAVVIATPPVSHNDIALAAFDAGSHVLCEKPLAMSSAEGREMVDKACCVDRILMTGLCHRFHEPVMLAKGLIESGELGRLIMFRNRFGGKQDVSATWFSKRELAGGGALMDTAVHSVDLFRHLVGDVKDVSARMRTYDSRISVEDVGIMLLESTEGVIGTIEASWATPGSANIVEVYGSSGAALIDYVSGFAYFTEAAGDWVRPEMSKPDRFVLQMEHFLDCVRTGRQPRVTGEDGVEALKILEAAYRSVERDYFDRPEIPAAE